MESRVADVVVRSEDGGVLGDERRDEVEGAAAGFARKHELGICVSIRGRIDWSLTYSVKTCFVLPRYALWEALRQIDTSLLSASRGGEHQRRFRVIVAAYRTVLVASIDEKLLDWCQRLSTRY